MQIFELASSPEYTINENGRGSTARLTYGVLETSDVNIAIALARALAPLAVDANGETIVRQTIEPKPTGIDSWEIAVGYGSEDSQKSQEPPTPGTWKFSFDTTGGRQTITTAPLVSRHWNDFFGEAPNLQGAINWDGQTAHGVEVIVPALKFTITAYYDPRTITTEFMREVARKTARQNDAEWLGFDPGEVLYFGGSGQGDIPTIAGQRVSPIAIQHTFEASETRTLTAAETDFTSGKWADGTENDEVIKRGWDYFWVWFKKRPDEDFSKVVGRPAHGYVHRPYRELDFAAFFGFGG